MYHWRNEEEIDCLDGNPNDNVDFHGWKQVLFHTFESHLRLGARILQWQSTERGTSKNAMKKKNTALISGDQINYLCQ